MINSRPNIGIVGGGIGGVAAAVALRQVGIDAVIYDKSPQLGEVGAGMMLGPNATRVLLRGITARYSGAPRIEHTSKV